MKNHLVNGDLVHQTALFLEVFPITVFAVAQLYAGKSANRDEAGKELERWRNTGKYSKEVENFCLDILSKRVGLNSVLGRRANSAIIKYIKGLQ